MSQHCGRLGALQPVRAINMTVIPTIALIV
jgi:hypothetical protein